MTRYSVPSKFGWWLFVVLVVASSSANAAKVVSGVRPPEASAIEIHTTGPNCWGTGELNIQPIGSIPGKPKLQDSLSMVNDELIRKHIGKPSFVNMSETEFSCVDGRYRDSIITTAGGDAAEFMLALRIANHRFGILMDQYVVSSLFRQYMTLMARNEPLRKFYMHTDEHAWEHLTEYLNLTEDFNILNTPDIMKEQLITAMSKPENIGCGHIKHMMKSPGDYKADPKLMKYFFRAFFEYMWLEDAERSQFDKKLLFIVLTGDHAEQAIMSVSFEGCEASLAPAVPSETPASSFFIHHNDASVTLRQNLANFFQSTFPTHVKDNSAFVSEMNAFYAVQLNQTLTRLAAGLPVFSLNIIGWQLSTLQTVTGSFIASSVALVVATALAFVISRRTVGSFALINLVTVMTTAVDRIIIRWMKIMTAFFIVLVAIFWFFFDWHIAIAIAFSTFVPAVCALLVFRFAPVAKARICAATLIHLEEGMQTALQSGVLVGLLAIAPIFFWLGLVCYFFHINNRSVLSFGLGLTLVNLMVRVGGSIFSKAVQHAEEERSHQRVAQKQHALVQAKEEALADPVIAKSVSIDENVGHKSPDHSAASSVPSTPSSLAQSARPTQLLDLIGHSVDDIMGTSLDLADSLVAALVSAVYVGLSFYGDDGMALPLWTLAVGLCSGLLALCVCALLLCCCGRQSEQQHLGLDVSLGLLRPHKMLRVLRFGSLLASALFLSLSAVAVRALNMHASMYHCIVIGHLGGWVLSLAAELATRPEMLSELVDEVVSSLPGSDLDDEGAPLDADMAARQAEADAALMARAPVAVRWAKQCWSGGARMAALAAVRVRRLVRGTSPADAAVAVDGSQNQSRLARVGALLRLGGGGAMQALVVGLSSAVTPILVVFVILLSCGHLGGIWGITMAGVSLMSTSVVAVAYCAMAPLLHSAQVLMTLSGQVEPVLLEARALTWIGDRAAQSVKGFTAGAASLASFCLFFTFTKAVGVQSVDLMKDPQVMPGLMLGIVMPFVFAGLTLSTLTQVSRRIGLRPKIVEEEMAAGSALGAEHLADLADDGLSSAMWHLLLPSAFAIGLTEFIGFYFGIKVLAGLLAGTIVSGLVMSTALRTTGDSIDNVVASSSASTSYALEEHTNQQHLFGASLKDAGGPSINVLTKLVCIIAIINQLSWALFVLVMTIVALVGSAFLFNYCKSGQASFDPSLMNQELSDNINSIKSKAQHLVPFSFGEEDYHDPSASSQSHCGSSDFSMSAEPNPVSPQQRPVSSTIRVNSDSSSKL